MRVQRLADNIVLGLAEQKSLWEAGFAVQDSAKRKELCGDLTLDLMGLAGILDAQIGADPTDIPHGSVNTLDVELILEADREAMQRPDGLAAILGEISVELFGSLKCLAEENLVEAVINLVSDSGSFAKSCCDLHCAQLRTADSSRQLEGVLGDDFNVSRLRKTANKSTSEIALSLGLVELCGVESPCLRYLRQRARSFGRGTSFPGYLCCRDPHFGTFGVGHDLHVVRSN